jgi:hypothetical protein
MLLLGSVRFVRRILDQAVVVVARLIAKPRALGEADMQRSLKKVVHFKMFKRTV